VLPALLGLVESEASSASIERCCLIRDVRGRLRLVVKPADGVLVDLEQLGRGLCTELGAWFAGPVLSTASGPPEQVRLAKNLMQKATPWPSHWPTDGQTPTGPRPIDSARWCALQRSLSKESWLTTEPASPPWPLVERVPAIVAFSSFKGGVGRSTALAVVAWQLARDGKKVVCIDLDLEAPGLGALFAVKPEGGVLDFLLTKLATEKAPDEDPALGVTVRGASLLVVPAGSVGLGYVEKLARLDFLSHGSGDGAPPSPVEGALRALLVLVRRLHEPDYILLDCRAGVSDIGGLTMNDLPHVDVLVGRSGAQWDAGLELALQVLAARRQAPDRRMVVVQNFAPLPLSSEESRGLQKRHRHTVYDMFIRWIWDGEATEEDAGNEGGDAAKVAPPSETDGSGEKEGSPRPDVPDEDDTISAHFPAVLGRYDELASAQTIFDVSEAVLANDAYTSLRSRIEAVAAPEPPECGDSSMDGASRA
jgi:Mrp family chromosome partitioning ATPase